jgi:hypothetical protein
VDDRGRRRRSRALVARSDSPSRKLKHAKKSAVTRANFSLFNDAQKTCLNSLALVCAGQALRQSLIWRFSCSLFLKFPRRLFPQPKPTLF